MGRGGDATNTGALSGPPVEQKQPAVRKKSGEEMMEAPIVHVDESFWVLVVLYLCYCGDYWALCFMLVEPLLMNLMCRTASKPGDSEKACNNIIPVDLRKEWSTPPDVLASITGGEGGA